MSKFGGLDYLLNVHDFGTSKSEKHIITDSAMDYVKFKHIPLQRRFTTRKRESDRRSRFDIRPFAFKNEFTFLTETSFSQVTELDKLFVFAHANEDEVGFTTARMLAGMLSACGLRRVGLITFKACEVGKGNFLEQFVEALERKAVAVGWVKGYKGSARTLVTRNGTGTVTALHENIYDDDKNRLTGDDRYKIVRGASASSLVAAGRYA